MPTPPTAYRRSPLPSAARRGGKGPHRAHLTEPLPLTSGGEGIVAAGGWGPEHAPESP